MLAALARGVLRARVFIVAAWLAAVPALALYGVGVLGELKPSGFRNPTADSTYVFDQGRRFLAADVVAVVEVKGGNVDDVEAWDQVVPALAEVERDPSVERVVDYYSTGAPGLASLDKKKVAVLIALRGTDSEKAAAARRLRPTLVAIGGPGTVTIGGYANVFDGVTTMVEDDLRRAEALALPITLMLLLLLFRSVVSASLPVLLGAIAVSSSLAILRAIHQFTDVTVFAANIASILGLGLSIDYSLFILMRFREELPRVGADRAVLRAMATTGRAVVFSGTTVAVSLCGLFLFPHPMLRTIAVGGIAVTLMTVALATTLLPAVLSMLGRRVDALKVPFGLPLPEEDDDLGLWARVATIVMRRPIVISTVVAAVLVVCALPFSRFAPSIADQRALPSGHEARATAELVDREFFAHQTTPHDVLVDLPAGASWDADRLRALHGYLERARAVPGVVRVDSTFLLGAGDLERAIVLSLSPDQHTKGMRSLFLDDKGARLALIGDSDPEDARAQEQVALLRALAPPPDMAVHVGGQAAWIADTRAELAHYAPHMIAFIAAAMLVVLFLVFGSLVLPLKAIAMNILSLTASFGCIVWIFQDGRAQKLLGYESIGSTESVVPVLMFAIVFGLSMDYEVLLLSRVREEYVDSGDNTLAVARGLQRTGRLITSAALLLVVVVLCFATSSLMMVKTLAVGIATAIALDATIVRSLLVPATMRLLGDWNWWAPPFLARLWRRIGVRD